MGNDPCIWFFFSLAAINPLEFCSRLSKRQLPKIRFNPAAPSLHGKQPLPRPIFQQPIRLTEPRPQQRIACLIKRLPSRFLQKSPSSPYRSLSDCLVIPARIRIRASNRFVIGADQSRHHTRKLNLWPASQPPQRSRKVSRMRPLHLRQRPVRHPLTNHLQLIIGTKRNMRSHHPLLYRPTFRAIKNRHQLAVSSVVILINGNLSSTLFHPLANSTQSRHLTNGVVAA